MKISHCKLIRKQLLRLLKFFVLEVTARSAADILGIQPNTAMLFYKKIRQVISHHVGLQAQEVFDGAVELDESYFGGARKGKRGRGAAGKVVVLNHIMALRISGTSQTCYRGKAILQSCWSVNLFYKETPNKYLHGAGVVLTNRDC